MSRRVGDKEIAAFTREFATLAKADLPLDDSLRLLQDQASNPAMRMIVAELLSQVLDGAPCLRACGGSRTCSRLNMSPSSKRKCPPLRAACSARWLTFSTSAWSCRASCAAR
ncbi:MAG: type II secretion system F family protein [Rhodoblastus sp.]|nr:MAG: type II secretion system F family protein [Rhodoblastus sp.]